MALPTAQRTNLSTLFIPVDPVPGSTNTPHRDDAQTPDCKREPEKTAATAASADPTPRQTPTVQPLLIATAQ